MITGLGSHNQIICDGLGEGEEVGPEVTVGFISLFAFWLGGAGVAGAPTYQPRPVAIGYPLIF